MTSTAYLQAEIRELAQRPGISTSQVLSDLTAAGSDVKQLETLYNRLMEDLYGDDVY